MEIPLRAYGLQREATRFILRSRPEQGKLSAPKDTGHGGATVEYSPPADLTVQNEKFSYAVQNSAGVSAAAEITIAIVDQPPRLITPRELVFEEVVAGTTARQEFEIANEGGGLAEGEAVAPKPWAFAGSSTYRLKAGERQKLTLLFTPAKSGPFRSELRFTSQHDRATPLSGDAVAPVTLMPAALELRATADRPARRGAVEIRNRTAQEIVLTVEPSARLRLPPQIRVPALGASTLAIGLEPGDFAALREDVRLQMADTTLSLPVTAAARRASLRLAPAAIRLPGTDTITAENTGGTDGIWKCEAAAPFDVSPAKFLLRPGETRTLAVQCLATDRQPHEGMLRFTGEQQVLEIPVETAFALASSVPGPRHLARATLVSAVADEASPPADEADPRPDLHVVPGARVIAWTSSTVRLRWPLLASAGKPVRMVYLTDIKPDAQGGLTSIWSPYIKVKFLSEGENTVAELHGLQPGRLYTFGIVEAGAEAGAQPLFTIDAATAQGTSALALTPLRAGFAALFLLGGYYLWRRWRGES